MSPTKSSAIVLTNPNTIYHDLRSKHLGCNINKNAKVDYIGSIAVVDRDIVPEQKIEHDEDSDLSKPIVLAYHKSIPLRVPLAHCVPLSVVKLSPDPSPEVCLDIENYDDEQKTLYENWVQQFSGLQSDAVDLVRRYYDNVVNKQFEDEADAWKVVPTDLKGKKKLIIKLESSPGKTWTAAEIQALNDVRNAYPTIEIVGFYAFPMKDSMKVYVGPKFSLRHQLIDKVMDKKRTSSKPKTTTAPADDEAQVAEEQEDVEEVEAKPLKRVKK